MPSSHIVPDNSAQLEGWRHALKNVYQTLELWDLQQKKMAQNIFYLAVGMDDKLVTSYGSIVFPSREAVDGLKKMRDYLQGFQSEMATKVVEYLTQPLVNYTPRSHTVYNKMDILIREEAVEAGLSNDAESDDDTDATVEFKCIGQRKKPRALPLAGVVRWVALMREGRGGQRQVATQGKPSKGLSRTKSFANSVASAARIDAIPGVGPTKSRNQAQRKSDAIRASLIRNSSMSISGPIPMTQQDRPEEMVPLPDRSTINLAYRAEKERNATLTDLIRMTPYERNREFVLAAVDIILYSLPPIIFERQAGPTLLGEGQYMADPSDVARFYPQIMKILVQTMLRNKLNSKKDPVVYHIEQMMDELDRRISDQRQKIASQQVKQFKPLFSAMDIVDWHEAGELEPNTTNYSLAPGNPCPDLTGGQSGRMTPRPMPEVTSACFLMRCYLVQQSALVEQISQRMRFLTQFRPAIISRASPESSPYSQFIGIMLFLQSCMAKLTKLIGGMEDLLERLRLVENYVTSVTAPGVQFPDMTGPDSLGIRASLVTEFDDESECGSSDQDDDIRAVYDQNISAESPLSMASGGEKIELMCLVNYSDLQNLNYERIGDRLRSRMSAILADAGTLPLPPSTPENVYVYTG